MFVVIWEHNENMKVSLPYNKIENAEELKVDLIRYGYEVIGIFKEVK